MTTSRFGIVLFRVAAISLLWSSAAMAACPDGVVDVGDGETCDDNNGANGDGCSDSCLTEPGWTCTGAPSTCTFNCGNSTIEAGDPEECDDGNTTNGDGCSDSCLQEPGWTCTANPGAPPASVCTFNCGNGTIEAGDPEECDDGNTTNGDGCSDSCLEEDFWTCTANPTPPPASVCTFNCGNGTIEAADGEECDDGNTTNGDGCSDSCLEEDFWTCTANPTPPPASVCTFNCGNGTIEAADGEECDDGNTTNGDGCSDSCLVETGYTCPTPGSPCTPVCGDGMVIAPEMCDDGNATGGDGCDATCTTEAGWTCTGSPSVCSTTCGDGIVAGAEACDTGGVDTVTCDGGDCTVATCGDGYTNTALGEECDDGAGNSNTTPDACRTNCVLPSCGDGVTDTGEECDTGTSNSDTAPDACRTNCVNPSCGDNVTDTGEACDGTDPTPGFVCSASDSGLASACRADCTCCGDFAQQPAHGEECDLAQFNSDTDPDACRTDCLLASCGDDVTDSGETCDGTDPGFTFCTSCRDATSTNPCTCCGDGFTDTAAGEECDDAQFNSDTDPDACRTNCLNPSCGDGVTDTGEECDDGAANSDTTPDACRTNCVLPACGDNVVDTGETCDGTNPGSSGCSASGSGLSTECFLPSAPYPCTCCGDGVVQPGEGCDTGGVDTPTCDGAGKCTFAGCGDGYTNAAAGEECDDGTAANSNTTPDACRTNCVLPSCGDGVTDTGEDCDPGPDVAGDCCGATCQFELPSFVCRPPAGQCDAAENCSGTSALCPTDFPKPPASPCVSGGPGGACDAPDFCILFTCPDAVLPGGFCRLAAGGPMSCDLPESCDGINPQCPPDAFQSAGTPCFSGTPETGLCEAPDTCPGGSAVCPDRVKPAAFPCRISLGVCDSTEFCDGTTGDCPADALDPAGTECRASGGVCDVAEECDGASPTCPPDAKVPAAPPTECRASAGDCDPAENCDGINNACPADVLSGPAVPCGPVECRDTCSGTDPVCPTTVCARFNVSEKGSLLYFSALEVGFSPALTTAGPGFALTSDTFITLVNDFNREVCVQWYFINGDAPLAAMPGIERAHPGWNSYDCMTCYTPNENVFMSLARGGGSLGCQPLTGLDPGFPPGRPDPDGLLGDRIVRGYAIAFAVDRDGNPISWNHLSGHVTVVNYRDRSAWEYNTYALQCMADPVAGNPCGTDPTTLSMDGQEYGLAWDKLLFDFYAVDATAFGRVTPAAPVTLDTKLTLYPVSVDLRPNSTNTSGPVLTRADIVIWNENEDDRTGTSRCINCWDQSLLSNYDAPNNFTRLILGTDKGYARIDGVRADSCEGPGLCCCIRRCSNGNNPCENDSWCGTPPNQGTCGLFGCFDPDCDQVDFARGTPDRDCSENAALLGVADKILTFLGAVPRRTDAGTNLVAIGLQPAVIRRDLIPPTAPLKGDKRVPPRRGSR